MEGLRDDQRGLLARHQEQAFDALLPASAAQGTVRLRVTPEGRALLALPPALLVSVAVSAVAAAVESRRMQQEQADSKRQVRAGAQDVFWYEVIETLKRRRLPFAPPDIELILDLGTSTMDPDRMFGRSFEALALGVAASANLLPTSPGSPPVIAALERAGSAIDALGLVHTSDPGRLRRRIRALVAANVPGGLLDLSVVDARDAWAELASDVLRRHAQSWDGVHELLALLAAARSTRPSQAWRRRAAQLTTRYDGYGELLRELLEPILEIDLTPSDVGWPPAWLLAPGNELLARGATWATADVDAKWVVPLLGRLALRCAAPSPHPTVTTALAHAVASGAVEALAAIGTPAAHDELRMLLGEIRRRDMLKRIATIVGEPTDQTRGRDDRIRLQKQSAVQRKADPEPKERQRAASAYVRRDLAPRLRESGFEDSSGRTFWRALDDRVEVLQCKAHRGGLTLELGIWFRFVPRRHPVPQRSGRSLPGEFACDMRGNVHAWHDDLVSAAEKAERWFARWRPLPVVLRWLLEGKQSEEAHGWGAPGSPLNTLLSGYIARETGDLDTACEQLARAAAYVRDQLDSPGAEVTPEWEAWVRQVESDASSL